MNMWGKIKASYIGQVFVEGPHEGIWGFCKMTLWLYIIATVSLWGLYLLGGIINIGVAAIQETIWLVP